MLDIATEEAGAGRRPGAYAPPKAPPMEPGASFFKKVRLSIANPILTLPPAVYHRPYLTGPESGTPVAHICDPEILEEMLVRRWREFPKSDLDRRVFQPLLGEGLLTAEGDDWKWKRRLAAPTFSPAALARMAPVMVAPFEKLAAEWSAAPREADVDRAMVRATLDVIERILFADPSEMDLAAIAEATDRYLAPMGWVEILAMLKLPEWLPFPGRGGQMRAKRQMRGAVLGAVRKRREALAAGAEPPADLTSALLAARDPETDRPLSDEDMVDMLLTLVGAGHETSAHTMSWALYCLAHQPALQDELAAEARQAAAAGPLGVDSLAALARCEAAIKETLRLFPVAPMIARVTTRAEGFGELELPKGTFCVVPIYALHRHALYWERPDEFDIGRFLNQSEPSRTLYMPFGAGPRICIGARMAMMETTLGLAALLTRLRFEPCPQTDCDPLHRVTLRPRGGLRLKILPRD